ncbi:choline-sulfatase [Paenibacillus baekrokdamisoli]|uniref:Choline-sulfatase n=1 Tax=Paenibacillus baekrokdamisoli TaxID=1712516 RepID=A0A3G9JIY4_9BACL|nr:sulfatase-like hydrolase/transferase [Paenibacillus baekrokdamisoli]MBB3068018.1 choline-sulfatase [Paenibacillus baekrokdamisoli]BBH22934.1 choline-sulfatase [Paenibacillus baekrokdamisoli]
MSNKPNLLLIMCDQLRFDVLGCYGNNLVKTPNIDRLAKRGICFDNAYSQTPVCMPARHGLISGLHPFELGLTDNTENIEEISDPLPKLVREQAYFTCAVGKMHFVPVREHHGFDRMYLSEEIPTHIQDDDYLLFLQEQGYSHIIEPHGKRSENYYVPQVSDLLEEMHSTAWVGNKTCEVIRGNKNRPFFIYTSFIKPHPPFDPCSPYNTMYDIEDIPAPIHTEEERVPDDLTTDIQNDYKVNGIENVNHEEIMKLRAHYYGCVSFVDKQVGKILDTLDNLGLTDNTLIIFTSDHGELLGDHYAFGKRSYYEASTRVPMIVSWPSVLPLDERRAQFTMLQDIYSTFITVSGGTVPAASSGKNLIQAGIHPEMPFRNKVIAEFGRRHTLKMMIRWENYKYIYHANGGLENLYDLKADPNELHNIADQYPQICANCREELAAYYKSYDFSEALSGEQLIKYDRIKHEFKGYLNQYPVWCED